jgi:RPA family protein
MSANGNGDDGDSDDGGPGTREVAYRLFAAEFEDCDRQFSESDEERAPNYVITPTGGRVNRLFLTGVLTELEAVNESMVRARIVDPTGAFVVYAGQYQPEALAFLERVEPPAFLAVTGKARTYQPDDSDVVYSSVRPESISEVDAGTRDRWVVSTAEQTLERVGLMATAIDSGLDGDALRAELESAGVDPALAQGIALARKHYDTTPAYLDALRTLALDATRVVADELEEAGALTVAPDAPGDADLAALLPDDMPTIAAPEGAGAGGDESRTREPTGGADEEAAETTPDAGAAATTTGSTQPTGEATDTEAAATVETDDASSPPGADAVEAGDDSAATDESEPGPATDAAGEGADAEAGADDELGEFEPGEFDEEPDEDPLGDDVREQVEEEYGTEFSTGSEVESEPELEPGDEPAVEPGTEPEPEADAESEPEAESGGEAEPASEGEGTDEDVDLSEAVMDAMRDLDDGDGAPHGAVVERVVDRTGASPDEVEDAVQDALMGGQCYEPDDGVLKPI